MDQLYTKNVVLRFVEAALQGSTKERDAMVPAVATVLGATPQELHHLVGIVEKKKAGAGVGSLAVAIPNPFPLTWSSGFTSLGNTLGGMFSNSSGSSGAQRSS